MPITTIQHAALSQWVPPARLRLSEWIERELVLPEGVSALPGRVRLHPYQREIADAISDVGVERITLVKGVRIGFTTLLTGAIGSYVANEPSPILVLLPTESDCQGLHGLRHRADLCRDAGVARCIGRRCRGGRTKHFAVAALPRWRQPKDRRRPSPSQLASSHRQNPDRRRS